MVIAAQRRSSGQLCISAGAPLGCCCWEGACSAITAPKRRHQTLHTCQVRPCKNRIFKRGLYV
ncbi:hypothetical protein F7725_006847 [Dissostichus mawsoni]|uniref:Uncharacterized protein n=1 Tax=Dissostichus mawsoni TaxID=36200 RepID=A0A7J5XV31_DISMA|nr:hypothetical protein F7725_006847 [Dissostichus mawsoni]